MLVSVFVHRRFFITCWRKLCTSQVIKWIDVYDFIDLTHGVYMELLLTLTNSSFKANIQGKFIRHGAFQIPHSLHKCTYKLIN